MSRAAMITLTPLLTRRLHASLPTPDVPPVTTATLPDMDLALDVVK
eukprot:CAMPEP_0173385946 /NCGR_PEP_ID=MMETSP1356-20130122/8551_1 /TAXON_ID=77927 ORGANISM="Hemiselmis virescens, Strain PCC157" /NCGR_SAMPLE_ID=MMETSP1356 /ASSEMBLY_ACC=CAM_ASM_000847 /LENGTH=45 /DNA_ID= /DNA_START= /DNA_END= /DNA_ORIENTATION=